jgi:hypothetical protein
LSSAPDRIEAVLEDARPGAAWRALAGLDEPSPELGAALGELAELVEASADRAPPTVETVMAAMHLRLEQPEPDHGGLRRLVQAVLQPALEWQLASA